MHLFLCVCSTFRVLMLLFAKSLFYAVLSEAKPPAATQACFLSCPAELGDLGGIMGRSWCSQEG